MGEQPTRSQPYQMALAEFMSDGSFAGFLRRMRRIYAERHALLSEGLY
jgi:DNA-binding transcriptional MocR family regulator